MPTSRYRGSQRDPYCLGCDRGKSKYKYNDPFCRLPVRKKIYIYISLSFFSLSLSFFLSFSLSISLSLFLSLSFFLSHLCMYMYKVKWFKCFTSCSPHHGRYRVKIFNALNNSEGLTKFYIKISRE